MAELDWMNRDDDAKTLYGEALAFGANSTVLASKVMTESFVLTKNRLLTAKSENVSGMN